MDCSSNNNVQDDGDGSIGSVTSQQLTQKRTITGGVTNAAAPITTTTTTTTTTTRADHVAKTSMVAVPDPSFRTQALAATATAATTATAAAGRVRTSSVAIRNPYARARTNNSNRSSSSNNNNNNNNSSSSNNSNNNSSSSVQTQGSTRATVDTQSVAPEASGILSCGREAAAATGDPPPVNTEPSPKPLPKPPPHPQQPAFWERLPTRTVSIRPAEVLTVRECLRSGNGNSGGPCVAELYHNRDQPVRVTGRIAHRSFVPATVTDQKEEEDGDAILLVELKLEDPVPRRSSSSSPSMSMSIASSRPAGKPKASIASKPRRRKRPWFGGSGSGSGNCKLPRRTAPSSMVGQKSTTTATAKANANAKAAPPETSPADTLLSVLADPRTIPRLDAARVGSVATVLGTLVPCRVGGETEIATSTAAPSSSSSSSTTTTRGYRLEARTLHVAATGTTTDMVFYETALMARRRAVYKRYYAASDAGTNDHASDVARAGDGSSGGGVGSSNSNAPPWRLLQGCGPPPYDGLSETRNE
eukprot:jgi/Psemu1/39393/gm1.39393_g